MNLVVQRSAIDSQRTTLTARTVANATDEHWSSTQVYITARPGRLSKTHNAKTSFQFQTCELECADPSILKRIFIGPDWRSDQTPQSSPKESAANASACSSLIPLAIRSSCCTVLAAGIAGDGAVISRILVQGGGCEAERGWLAEERRRGVRATGYECVRRGWTRAKERCMGEPSSSRSLRTRSGRDTCRSSRIWGGASCCR